MLKTLSNLFPKSFLTLRTERMPKAQLKVYAWCAEEHRWDFNWMAFLDMDEFLIIREQVDDDQPNLKGFFDQFKHAPGLAVNWIAVGPSGRAARPAAGGMLKSYDMCIPKPDGHVKTIANTYFLDGIAMHPHNHHFRYSFEFYIYSMHAYLRLILESPIVNRRERLLFPRLRYELVTPGTFRSAITQAPVAAQGRGSSGQ
jgi:hypothetical protein